MKQEPVAWMLNGKLHDFDPTDWAKEQYPDKDVIPLYTAPQTISTPQPQTFTGENPFTKTRELSDVEIHYEVDKWERQNNYKHDADVHKTLIDFARAILKKASEK